MSRPVSRYLHPFDAPSHPAYEPEVAVSKLGSWGLDCAAARPKSVIRRSPALPHDECRPCHQANRRGGGQTLS